VYNLAWLFSELMQYKEAISRLEEALVILRRVFGSTIRTVMTAKGLARVCQLAAQSDHGAIDVGHNFHICSFWSSFGGDLSLCSRVLLH
jgi:hypothetical protein